MLATLQMFVFWSFRRNEKLLTLAVQNTCSKMGTCKHMATINTQKQKFKQHRFKHGGLVLITLYHGCRIHVQRDPHKNLGFPLPTVHTPGTIFANPFVMAWCTHHRVKNHAHLAQHGSLSTDDEPMAGFD